MENSELYKFLGINIDYLWREVIDNDNQEVVKEFVGIFFSIDECEIELNDDGFCEVVVDDNI